MRLPEMAFTVFDWPSSPVEDHPGAEGASTWRQFQAGELRVRIVEYGAGYVADHWCERGHVLLVLSGGLVVRLRDERVFTLGEGQGFCVSDCGDAAHMVVSEMDCRVFIVD